MCKTCRKAASFNKSFKIQMSLRAGQIEEAGNTDDFNEFIANFQYSF